MAGTVELNIEAELRKWCLERAFELRALTKVNHMQVTNVAEEYYRWIVYGESQGNKQALSVNISIDEDGNATNSTPG